MRVPTKMTNAIRQTTCGVLLFLATGLAWADVLYVHTDHLGTPRLATNEQGVTVWRNLPTTEPFGNAPVEEDPDGDSTLNTLNLRFPGQYADKETNLNYNYFRDYDPSTGRYVQSDPIGLRGGINTYGYVGGNPLTFIDPLGLSTDDPLGGRSASPPIGIPNPSVQAQRQLAQQLQRALNRLFCDPDCSELQEQISALAGELRIRFVQMTADASNLYCTRPIGQFSWVGHQLQYNQKQKRLQKLIAQAKAQNCPVDPEDERLANTPPPDCPAR